MARITIASLTAQLQESQLQATALARLVEHALDLERGTWVNNDFDQFMAVARKRLAAPPAAKRTASYQPRPVPPEVLARREAMQRAREMAVKSGRCVVVDLAA